MHGENRASFLWIHRMGSIFPVSKDSLQRYAASETAVPSYTVISAGRVPFRMWSLKACISARKAVCQRDMKSG